MLLKAPTITKIISLVADSPKMPPFLTEILRLVSFSSIHHFLFRFLPVFNKKQAFTVYSPLWLEPKRTSPISIGFPYQSFHSAGHLGGFPQLWNYPYSKR